MDKLSAEQRGGPVCHPARYRPSPPTLDMGTEGEGGGGVPGSRYTCIQRRTDMYTYEEVLGFAWFVPRCSLNRILGGDGEEEEEREKGWGDKHVSG